MLLLLGFFLVPMVFGAEGELKVNNYILEIDECHTLKSVRPTEESTSVLDLSSLGIECVDKNAFQNLDNVKTLNLANNSLYGVPAAVFANLTNLEHLSLAGNKMARFENTFVGLENLKSLNISDLPMENLYEGYLYGLTKATDIIVLNNKFSSLYSNTFAKGPNYDEPLSRKRRLAIAPLAVAPEGDKKDSNFPAVKITTSSTLYEHQRVQVCVREGVLTRVESLEREEEISNGCTKIEVSYWDQKLNLENLNITKFEAGWYRRKAKEAAGYTGIHLRGNNIVRITSELLNDLPEDVWYVSLAGNKIERLEKGVMKSNHIKTLDLSNNFISEIEDGALENMKLTGLYLTNNRLKDTKFAATLPSTLTTMKLDSTGITELTPASFSKLNYLTTLNLQHNNITNLQRDSLQGLSSLSTLDMNDNSLSKIEPGSLRHLKKVQGLIFSKNNIDGFEKGVFDGLETLFLLNLASNKFTKITKDTFSDMSENIVQLYLDNNEIESVEAGAFAKLPIHNLALNGNKISKIEKGSFDTPELEILSLNGNLLSNVDGDSFEGLENLGSLTLSFNGITKLTKGSMKHLKKLQFLDISGNPIKRLDNGALFGISKAPPTRITLRKGSLEVLQGGVFDDA